MRTARTASAHLALGAVLLALLAAMAPPGDAGEPVVLGRIFFRNPRTLADKVTRLADKVWPGAGGEVAQGAAELFQEPDVVGVDWSKPVSAVLLSGKAFNRLEPAAVAFFSLGNPEQFRNAARPGGEVAEVRGNVGLLTDVPGALQAIPPDPAQASVEFPKEAGDADVCLTFQVSDSLAEYKAEIDGRIIDLEAEFGGFGPLLPREFLSTIINVLRGLAPLVGKQARQLTVTVHLRDDAVELRGSMVGVAGGELAAFLASQPAEQTDLPKYLPPEAAAAVAAKLDLSKLRPLLAATLNALAGPLELTPERQEKILDLFSASAATGETALAIAGGPGHPGIQSIQVSRITDPQKYRSTMKAAFDWVAEGDLGAALRGLGLRVTVQQAANVRQYKDVPIDQYSVTIGPAPNPDAPPNPFLMGPPVPKVTQVAAFDTLAIATSNNAIGDLMNGAIDRIKGGGQGLDASPAYQRARAAAPQAASVLFFLSLQSSVAKVMEHVAKQFPIVGLVAAGLIQADPNEEPITGYASFSKDGLELAVRVPHQPIVALTTRLRQVAEQFGPQLEVPPPEAPKAPVPAAPKKGGDVEF